MLLFLILLFFGSRLTPYLCLLKWCFCFNLFFTLLSSAESLYGILALNSYSIA